MLVNLPTEFYIWFWRFWIAAFFLVETVAIIDMKPGDTLTENTRPLFHAHPLLWFLTAGALMWVNVHFLAPALERTLKDWMW